MVLLLVSLGRTIKTMISSTNVIIFSTDTVRAACGAKLPHVGPDVSNTIPVRLKCNALKDPLKNQSLSHSAFGGGNGLLPLP